MDSADPLRGPRPEVVWLRPDPMPRLAPRWWLAGLTFVGGALLARFGDGRLGAVAPGPALGAALVLVGVLLVLAGVTFVFVSALRALADETCLAIRRDGLLYRRGGAPDRVVPWHRLGVARVEADGVVTVDADDGPPLRIVSAELGSTPEALAALVDTSRRRALMGLPLLP